MWRRVGIICLLVGILGVCFWWSEQNNKSCTLRVETAYGGYGFIGQDLGSGVFVDTFVVTAGDRFRELDNGHWEKLELRNYKSDAILSIIKINKGDVVVEIGGEEVVLQYGITRRVKSTMVVHDGTNYTHKICFGKE